MAISIGMKMFGELFLSKYIVSFLIRKESFLFTNKLGYDTFEK